MLIVGVIEELVESDLVAGRLLCPGCGDRLRPWGSARERELRSRAGTRWFRPRRASGRGAHTAVALESGAVLATGGFGVTNVSGAIDYPPAEELYVPAPRISQVTPELGSLRGGTVTTIRGFHLSGVTSLGFGDTTVDTTPCPSTPSGPCFSVDSPTQITAVTPAHPAGRVVVHAEGPGGTSRRLDESPGSKPSFVFSEGPGAVDLRARALTPSDIELLMTAADDGTGAPARQYVVKQSSEPIDSDAAFEAATALAVPLLVPTSVGQELRLVVADLSPATTYHYAVRAENGGLAGPISESVAVTTPSESPAADAIGRCSPVATPGVGQHLLGGGRYHLVSLPGGTVVGSDSPRYGWFDAGAGGSYAAEPATAPVTAGRAYWVYSFCDRVVALGSSTPNRVSMPLGLYHASMVGNPSASSPADLTGHDFAAAWDPDANGGSGGYRISSYRQAQTLAVGEGSWVFSYVDTTITVAVQE